ncbi:putative nicotinate-nucleotide adenylyltransferase [Magnetospirillum sp. LM-5]|uniref:nicotinate-nucleotide adenylyltransferase n=1 Tax=Magnetospirillum sp. LM-5 TaxID=2681466 RepID=UPI001383C627|nr:nicotinate-nucleotide adenylyltransferase [Magnetospirillum sp. LM-5]CAA7625288.1 putative nicotinate-nucleotide adenylyltransferase [Magnetospirillum sp. LM-5]
MSRFAPNPWGDGRRARIGLLGGSFNPAHDGHRHVAELALKLLRLDQVWLLVSPQNPLKPAAGMAALADRLASARAVIGGHPRLIATDIERFLRTRVTVATLAALRTRFRQAAFVWLMGADNLVQVSRWARWPKLFQAVPVAILARAPYSWNSSSAKAARRFGPYRLPDARSRGLVTKRPPAWVFLHTRLHPASATAIRNERTWP